MINIRVPATSANLGTGFDCLGIALDIYNTFEVRESDTLLLENTEKRFCNENNLFVQAYRACGGKNIAVRFHCDVPVSRGLGSSATLIVGGIVAYQLLHGGLCKEDMLKIADRLEGHPDNVAPAFCGGFTGCLKTKEAVLVKSFPVADSYCFTVLIPDFEVTTNKARAVLPESYQRAIVSHSLSSLLFTVSAMESGNLEELIAAENDCIHEPYRKPLIDEFDKIAAICENDTRGKVIISGSGSTCLFISHKPLSGKAKQAIHCLHHHWQVKEVHPSNGVCVRQKDGLWKTVI